MGPYLPVCSTTPRFSYDGSKTRVSTAAWTSDSLFTVHGYRGMGTRWVGGGVYRVGRWEGYTGYPAGCCEEVPGTAKRAP